MTTQSVANHVDNDVVLEGLSVVCSHFEGSVNRFQVVSIDVNDWCINGFCQVSGIHSTSSFGWNRRESDLVVYNNVNGTTNCIVLQILHLH